MNLLEAFPMRIVKTAAPHSWQHCVRAKNPDQLGGDAMAIYSHLGRQLCVVVTLFTGLLAGSGELNAQALSCTKLPMSGFAISSPISCTVNCSAGGTIASALRPKAANHQYVNDHNTGNLRRSR
jgi:hypothetical protein